MVEPCYRNLEPRRNILGVGLGELFVALGVFWVVYVILRAQVLALLALVVTALALRLLSYGRLANTPSSLLGYLFFDSAHPVLGYDEVVAMPMEVSR